MYFIVWWLTHPSVSVEAPEFHAFYECCCCLTECGFLLLWRLAIRFKDKQVRAEKVISMLFLSFMTLCHISGKGLLQRVSLWDVFLQLLYPIFSSLSTSQIQRPKSIRFLFLSPNFQTPLSQTKAHWIPVKFFFSFTQKAIYIFCWFIYFYEKRQQINSSHAENCVSVLNTTELK